MLDKKPKRVIPAVLPCPVSLPTTPPIFSFSHDATTPFQNLPPSRQGGIGADGSLYMEGLWETRLNSRQTKPSFVHMGMKTKRRIEGGGEERRRGGKNAKNSRLNIRTHFAMFKMILVCLWSAGLLYVTFGRPFFVARSNPTRFFHNEHHSLRGRLFRFSRHRRRDAHRAEGAVWSGRSVGRRAANVVAPLGSTREELCWSGSRGSASSLSSGRVC